LVTSVGKPFMGMIIQRLVVPAVAALAGMAAIVCGAMYHRAPVSWQEVQEQEREEEVTKTIRVPVPFGPGGGSSPWGKSFITQKVKVIEKVKRPVLVTRVEDMPEPAMIREMTVGGIALGSGGLWRTYRPDEPPPLLCPS